MNDVMTMHQAAAGVGMAYRTFRREWPRLVEHDGFPRPFRGRVWMAEAVQGWIGGRRAANDAAPPVDAVADDRAELLQGRKTG